MTGTFSPFKMPDFSFRVADQSRSLKDSFAYLRSRGFPDKDLFIFPQGRFLSFKGEILDQRPQAGEIVSAGERIILIAAVPGLCDLMPDLFTDHRESSFFDEEFSPRNATRRLFAVFDSMYIKMLCRLDLVRDIYAGLGHPEIMADYISSFLNLIERNYDWITIEMLGFILPSLYGYLGTDSALRTYLESVLGIDCISNFRDNQVFPIPEKLRNRLGDGGQLGTNIYLGDRYKGGCPAFDLDMLADDVAKIEQIMPGRKGHEFLAKILELSLPHHQESYGINIRPAPGSTSFKSGFAHLGYGTVLGGIS
jgi:hypothetical protein